jgi:membrane-associated phospholipid phosphatase
VRKTVYFFDLLCLAFYLALALCAQSFGLRATFLGYFAAHLALNRLGAWRGGVFAIAHRIAPMAIIPYVFLRLGLVMEEMGIVPHLTGPGYDPAATRHDLVLKGIDVAMFGAYPVEWIRRFHAPWLTGILQIGYLYYYLSPVVVGIPLLVQRRDREFRMAAALIVGSLFVSYVGYFFVPATGPRFEGGIEPWLPAEPGWFHAETLYRFLNGIETFRWDAFPSGHVAVGLMTLFVAFKYFRRLGWILIAPVLALCLATVYMAYHYVIDVLAGIAIFALTAWLLPPAVRSWES